MKTRDWAAWYNRMPGADDPLLRVTGVCELPSSSMSVELTFVPDGVVDEPEVVTLRLDVTTPEVGDDQMTDLTVSWEGDVGPDITTVRIRVPDEAPISVDVTITV